MENSEKLKKAIAFATQAHNGQYRKGSDVEYITHPMEVLDILTSMNADENLLIAGVLHDTVEDTEVTMEDIAEQFGDDVAALIGGHTEDKSKSWDERKSAMIDAVDDGDRRLKMLVMSDLLSNMRSTWSDYQKIGDVVWEKFNAPRHRQSWYYSSMLDALCDMQWNEAAESVYWEATGIYKDIYVLYGLNQEENCLYQISAHGENAILHKGSPQWLNCPKTISEKMTVVSRKFAEDLEDQWNQPFWEQHDKDMVDGDYPLFSSEHRLLAIEMREHQLTFNGNDFGSECQKINGEDEYEFHYRLDEDNTHRLLVQLRFQLGLTENLGDLLLNAFGGDSGSLAFAQFCDENSVEYSFFIY